MITLPTLSQINTGILTDLETEYRVNISLKQRVALRAIAAVLAGALWLVYKVIGFLQKNIWPDTADSEIFGGTLERFGRIILGRNRKTAVPGQYSAGVTGLNGSTIPALSIFQSNTSSLNPGSLFILDNAYTLSGTSGTILLRALVAGIESKLSNGDVLNPTSPLINVDSTVTVTGEVVQPLAEETIEAYRTAIVNRYKIESQGGSPGDYRIWSQDAQGVKAIYPYVKQNETNANIIYIEATVADSIDGKGTPSQAIIDDVESVTNFNPDTSIPQNERGRRPNTVINYFEGVTPKNVDITITGGSFSVSEKSKILTAMQSAIDAIRPFVAAADPLVTKNNIIDTFKLNGIIYSAVPGAVYTGITLEINSVPFQSFTFSDGNIPYLNSIFYA